MTATMSARVIYEDDLVQLWHGDWRDQFDMLANAGADAIVTDPPYGETSLEWDRWVSHWVTDALVIAPALWCFGSFRMFHEHRDEFLAWKLSQEVVWEKHNGSGFHSDRFKRVHELAVLWYQGDWGNLHHETPTTADAVKRVVRTKRRPVQMGQIDKAPFVSEDGGPRLMRSVQYVRSEHGRAIHPTQKPEGIVAPLIEYSVPRGGLVVDLFAGSGTTAVVARHLGRRCISFEAREDYALAAAQRLSQQTFDLAGGVA